MRFVPKYRNLVPLTAKDFFMITSSYLGSKGQNDPISFIQPASNGNGRRSSSMHNQ